MCKIVLPPPTVHKARAGTIGNPIVTPRFRVSVEGTVKYRWPISLMTDGLQSGVYPMEHHCHVVTIWPNHTAILNSYLKPIRGETTMTHAGYHIPTPCSYTL